MLKREEKGITLLTLVITIIVLLILAGVTISSIFGDSGVIKNATEAQILSELASVKDALEMYKIENYSHGDMSNEELVEEGLLKEVFVKDTYRTVAVITNLETIGIKSKLGKGGRNQENTEEDTLLDMYNIYGIDMSDGTLYYIRDGIWSIEGEKIIYTASTGEEKLGYTVETINQQYVEDRKFITEWTVPAGTTITLPIIYGNPDITIEWGSDDDSDGKLDVEKCTTQKPTHTYTNAGTYTVKILGKLTQWDFYRTNTSKDYITGIKQWGNIGAGHMNFRKCTNLSGTIPNHKYEDEFSGLNNAEWMFEDCKKLTGSIPKNLFYNAYNLKNASAVFNRCSGLTGEIPEELFNTNTKITSVSSTFNGCSGLTGGIPKELFKNNKDLSTVEYTFGGCSGLTGEIPAELFSTNTEITSVANAFNGCTGIIGKIPENLFSNCSKLTKINSAFANTSITEIPAGLFDINNGQPNGIEDLRATFSGTKITTVPEGLFDLCTEVTTYGDDRWGKTGVFAFCSLLETIPDKLFYNNTKVKSFDGAFAYCIKLKEIPEDIFNTSEENVSMRSVFNSCSGLTTIKGQAFKNVPNISNMELIFMNCNKLETIEGGLVIPESVTNIDRAFELCSKLATTITLKSNQATYSSKNTFAQVSKSTLNWADPCTEEKVDEILAVTGGIQKGSKVD